MARQKGSLATSSRITRGAAGPPEPVTAMMSTTASIAARAAAPVSAHQRVTIAGPLSTGPILVDPPELSPVGWPRGCPQTGRQRLVASEGGHVAHRRPG